MAKIVASTGGGHGDEESAASGDDMADGMADIEAAVAEAVAAANAEQAAALDALTERVDAQMDGGERDGGSSSSNPMSVVALLAGLSGLGLGAAAFVNRKR